MRIFCCLTARLVIVGLFILFAFPARAAVISFSPAVQTLTVGNEITVIVRIDTRGQAINAIEGTIVYPANLLGGRVIDKTNSLITIWTENPVFNAGMIRFSGGRPKPGFTGLGEIMRVKFAALAQGSATIQIQDARTLLNDGNGTNVFESAVAAAYTIIPVLPPPPPPPQEPLPEPQPESAPEPEIGQDATPPVTSAEQPPIVVSTPTAPSVQVIPPSGTQQISPAPIGAPSESSTVSESAISSAIVTFFETPVPVITPTASIIEMAQNILSPEQAKKVEVVIEKIQKNKVYQVINKEIINNPAVEEVTVQVASPIIVTAAAANVVAAVNVARLLLYLQALFTQPLFLLTRRRRKQWGQVYSSLTKLPIDLAPVRLYDAKTGRLVRTRVTDKAGRYLLLTDPGSYRMEVTKTDFTFPSVLLREKDDDLDFTNLYHGDILEVTEKSTTITKSIPLDPIEQSQTPRAVIWRKRKRVIQKTVAWSGPLVAIVVTVIQPSPITVVLLGLQFGLLGVFKHLAEGKMPRSWATVRDGRTKTVLPMAVARIFDTQFNKLLDTQITDKYGRYAFLVGKGSFYITIEKIGYVSYRSGTLDFSRGGTRDLIKQDIELQPVIKDADGTTSAIAPSIAASFQPPERSAPAIPPNSAVGAPTVKNPSEADKPEEPTV